MDCCGLLFNEALREIHRLRSGFDGCEEPRLAVWPCSEQTPVCETRRTLASPPNDRLPYAVPALGDVQPHQREQPPVILPQHFTRMPVINNLGSLLYVLI